MIKLSDVAEVLDVSQGVPDPTMESASLIPGGIKRSSNMTSSLHELHTYNLFLI